MNVGMEKIFFRHILDHPEQFNKVDAAYFKNDDIRFVYSIIREEYIKSKKKIVPSPKQILAMVKLRADERVITKELLSLLLKQNNDQYEDEWLFPRFSSWKLSATLRDNVMKSIEYVRSLDESDYDNAQDIAAKIKNIANEISLIDDDNEDLGEDFDDPSAHRQDETVYKIPTGWESMDTLLGGGWDYASLVVLIGETNVGKCVLHDTDIRVRNKNTGKIENIKIGDFLKIQQS